MRSIMRHWMKLAAIAFAGACVAPAAAVPGEAPLLNSCHAGQCSWSLTRSRSVVRQDGAGTLYRLSLLGGSAREGSSRIRWNRQPHDLFIFCSPRLPTVILPDQGHLQVDILDFVAGPPPFQESSASLYVRTCHPGEDWTATGFAARHGYREQDADREIALSRPEDIFRYAR
jgi:hypothetical protein